MEFRAGGHCLLSWGGGMERRLASSCLLLAACVAAEENRDAYVDCMVDYHLNHSVKWQFDAFSAGFGVLCNGPALRLFNAAVSRQYVDGIGRGEGNALTRACLRTALVLYLVSISQDAPFFSRQSVGR
jgi:hypothetical protein